MLVETAGSESFTTETNSWIFILTVILKKVSTNYNEKWWIFKRRINDAECESKSEESLNYDKTQNFKFYFHVKKKQVKKVNIKN